VMTTRPIDNKAKRREVLSAPQQGPAKHADTNHCTKSKGRRKGAGKVLVSTLSASLAAARHVSHRANRLDGAEGGTCLMNDNLAAAQLLLSASASPQPKSAGNQTGGSCSSRPPGGGATLLSSLQLSPRLSQVPVPLEKHGCGARALVSPRYTAQQQLAKHGGNLHELGLLSGPGGSERSGRASRAQQPSLRHPMETQSQYQKRVLINLKRAELKVKSSQPVTPASPQHPRGFFRPHTPPLSSEALPPLPPPQEPSCRGERGDESIPKYLGADETGGEEMESIPKYLGADETGGEEMGGEEMGGHVTLSAEAKRQRRPKREPSRYLHRADEIEPPSLDHDKHVADADDDDVTEFLRAYLSLALFPSPHSPPPSFPSSTLDPNVQYTVQCARAWGQAAVCKRACVCMLGMPACRTAHAMFVACVRFCSSFFV
jgi:hypothetical protein